MPPQRAGKIKKRYVSCPPHTKNLELKKGTDFACALNKRECTGIPSCPVQYAMFPHGRRRHRWIVMGRFKKGTG